MIMWDSDYKAIRQADDGLTQGGASCQCWQPTCCLVGGGLLQADYSWITSFGGIIFSGDLLSYLHLSKHYWQDLINLNSHVEVI